jgi:hypothetical protein
MDLFAINLHDIPLRQNLIVPDTSSIGKLLFHFQLSLQLLLAQLCLFQLCTMNKITSVQVKEAFQFLMHLQPILPPPPPPPLLMSK